MSVYVCVYVYMYVCMYVCMNQYESFSTYKILETKLF